MDNHYILGHVQDKVSLFYKKRFYAHEALNEESGLVEGRAYRKCLEDLYSVRAS
ncbi:hypothetical protein ACWGOQ_0013775 [Aquimarina sp. M1]